MLWNFDEDAGSYLFGWLALENRSREPALVVVIDGRTRRRVVANFERVDLKAVGWHETGMCGFLIDREVCPELSPERDVEIFEEETNTLVFRRASDAVLPVRLFHLETQTFPVYALDSSASPFVQMKYDSAELIGEETLTNIIKIVFCQSLMVSGGINYRRYVSHLREHGYHCSVLLSDPLREIAGRLIQIQMLAANDAGQGWRRMGQGDLIEAFRGVDLRRPAALAGAFRKLSDEAFFSLADPTTRKLVSMTPQDPVEDHHVAAALDTLAEFDIIGFDSDLNRFVEHFESLFGNATLSRERNDDPPDFDDVLAAVSACRPVRELIRLDTAVFEMARFASAKASAAGSAGALVQR